MNASTFSGINYFFTKHISHGEKERKTHGLAPE